MDYEFPKIRQKWVKPVLPQQRIARCCNTCKFYMESKGIRGYCVYPFDIKEDSDAVLKDLLTALKGDKDMRKDFNATVRMGICDMHEYYYYSTFPNIVLEWMQKEALLTGELI